MMYEVTVLLKGPVLRAAFLSAEANHTEMRGSALIFKDPDGITRVFNWDHVIEIEYKPKE
jgi:hypothetical protein